MTALNILLDCYEDLLDRGLPQHQTDSACHNVYRFNPFDINTTQFIPITPKRSTIKSLKFIINPIEDPYKAYAENTMRTHPSVTIILTLGLSKETAEDYPDDFEDLTVQATVAAGVIGKLDAYPPMNDVLSKSNAASWLSDVLPAGVSK